MNKQKNFELILNGKKVLIKNSCTILVEEYEKLLIVRINQDKNNEENMLYRRIGNIDKGGDYVYTTNASNW